MDCLVSGVAARVIKIEGDDAYLIEADRPALEIKVTSTSIPFLMADAHDVKYLKNTSQREAFEKLLLSWNFDRGLRMLDIITDPESKTGEYIQAAEYLESFLRNEVTKDAVENFALSIPLSESSFLSTRKFTISRYATVCAFLTNLLELQPNIERVRASWDAISDSQFRDQQARASFENAAVFKGAFKEFAVALNNPPKLQGALFNCLILLKEEPNFRAVLSEWTQGFSTRPLKKKLPIIQAEIEDDDIELLNRVRLANVAIHEKYTAARKQQAAIIVQLENGQTQRARRFADELVESQVRDGGAKYAAMSLCAIAQEAKRLNNHSLQLEWVIRATELAPEDARTHGQAGDAYLGLFRLDEAIKEYSTASALSAEPFGDTGLARVFRTQGKLDQALDICINVRRRYDRHPEIYHAWALQSEILRDMWKLEEALALYKEGKERFSQQSVFWCGTAAVLRDMGRLNDALGSYQEAITQFPGEPVPRSGHADVLKLLGKLDESLLEYHLAIESFPHEPLLFCGRADVLRTKGKLRESLEAYEDAVIKFPFEPSAYTGRADTLRESGDVEGALHLYDVAVDHFPQDVRIRSGRARTLQATRRFSEALQAFDKNVHDFPYDIYSLAGRANLLRLLGRYEDAVDAYDAIISRRPDYVSARNGKAAVLILLGKYDLADALLPKQNPMTSTDWMGFHIRGMMYLKSNRIDEAIEIFSFGIRSNPFHRERQLFETGMAAARIKTREFSEAARLVESLNGSIPQLLKMHSFGALGDIERAKKAMHAVNDNEPPGIVQLRDRLAAKYKFTDAPAGEESLIFEQEIEVVLQAA